VSNLYNILKDNNILAWITCIITNCVLVLYHSRIPAVFEIITLLLSINKTVLDMFTSFFSAVGS